VIRAAHPSAAPRPAFISLAPAALAAVRHGNTLSNINVVRWAEIYSPATVEDVREAFERAHTELSRQPQNAYEVEGK
jgi:hypothetical protein